MDLFGASCFIFGSVEYFSRGGFEMIPDELATFVRNESGGGRGKSEASAGV